MLNFISTISQPPLLRPWNVVSKPRAVMVCPKFKKSLSHAPCLICFDHTSSWPLHDDPMMLPKEFGGVS